MCIRLSLLLLGALPVPALLDDDPRPAEKEEIGWEYKGQLDTEHFRIYYGDSRKLAEELGLYGEALYKTFQETFGDLGDLGATLPLRVYLFRTKKQYEAYAAELGPGLVRPLYPQFDPASRTAYMCEKDKGSTKEFLVQTFVHENTHALSGKIMWQAAGIGTWLTEGWADYMQLSVDYEKGALELGKISQTSKSRHPDVVKLLIRQGKLIPLADLITMDRVAFHRDVYRTYPESWSLFYFLRHYGSGAYREGLKKYIGMAAEGKGGKEAFEEVIGPIDKIAKEWEDYVRTLSSDRVR